MTSVLPVPRTCSLQGGIVRGLMPRPGARIWSTSLRIMIDAIGAEGALTDHPSGEGPLVRNVGGISRRTSATFGVSPTSTVAASVVTSAPDAT